MLPFYSRFIGGSTKNQLADTIKANILKYKLEPIIDLAKEHSTTKKDVILYSKTLKDTAEYLANTNIPYTCALKLSSFLPFKPYHMLEDMIQFLGDHKVQGILLDAESNSMRRLEQETFSAILGSSRSKHLLTNSYSPLPIYKTYQMYRRDALDDIKSDIEIALNSTQPSSPSPTLNIKLVRGAYMQQDQRANVLFDTKQQTDDSYNSAIQYIHDKITTSPATGINLLVASHNELSCALAMNLFHNHRKNIAFAQLLGMNDLLSRKCAQHGFKTYKYVPFGPFDETIPYLTRRLYENYDIIKHVL